MSLDAADPTLSGLPPVLEQSNDLASLRERSVARAMGSPRSINSGKTLLIVEVCRCNVQLSLHSPQNWIQSGMVVLIQNELPSVRERTENSLLSLAVMNQPLPLSYFRLGPTA